jgi:uncharacterized protein YidB (DUF937 family)
MLGKTKFIIAGVIVFALLVTGIGGTIVLAQGPTQTPPAKSQSGWSQLYLQALAQKLGTTVDKLQQAMTDARKDALGQAVKQGILTQTQADAMQQRLQHVQVSSDVRTSIANAWLDAAAKTLGLSSADLTTALKSKTLLTLAQEKNVDVTKLRTAIADAQKAVIDQAVRDGKLTQAQADTLKANIKPENINVNRRVIAQGMRGGLNGTGKFNGQFAPRQFGRR